MSAKSTATGAIELGQVSSVIGFCDPNQRVFLKSWTYDSSRKEEVPTCLLLNPDGKTVHSFGADADEKYKELYRQRQHVGYYFFRGLKDICGIEEGNLHAMMTDESGKKLKATSVLGLMLTSLIKEGRIDTEDDVDWHWIVLLPASSTPSFLALMKKARLKAGFDEKQMTLARSTTAAALLFKNLPDGSYVSKPGFKLLPGMQFLTVIAGDESVDTIVHRLENDGKITDVGSLKRCSWGIAMIVEEFEKLLLDIFGKNTIDQFKTKCQEDWMDLISCCKSKIVQTRLASDDLVTFRLPSSLTQMAKKLTGKTLLKLVKLSKFNTKIAASSGILQIPFGLFLSLFSQTLQEVVSHIEAMIQDLDIRPSAMMMVGTFSEVCSFQNVIEDSFPDIAVVRPPDASKAVLKGVFKVNCTTDLTEILQESRPPLVVVAIDFGTTYSGWTRSFQHEFSLDPTKAQVRNWNSGSALTEKTPTCVLIRSDGETVEKFGYDAIRQYEESVRKKEEQNYFYFKHFKMFLQKKLSEKLDRGLTIDDVAGRPLPALDVFAASIRFLKDDYLENNKNTVLGSLSDDEVQWVLTVPAIWSDGAKQFMREAAIKAGIRSRRLRLVLEPEAASIYCRHLPVEVQGEGKETSISRFKPGTRYMILDAGGGTVDITVHEVVDSLTVKEVHSASGGGWGGLNVNFAFEELMKDIFGEPAYDDFCRTCQDERQEILDAFEIKKRNVTPNGDTPIHISFPSSLIDAYKCNNSGDLAEALKASKYADSVKIVRNKLILSAELCRSLFTTSIESIVAHVDNLLKETEVSAILMVGGYSDSSMLQGAIKSHFSSIRIVVPPDAGTSIMKGALIFGHRPHQIKQRVLKYTYGVNTCRPFKSGDPEGKRLKTDDVDKCDKVFNKHVQKGQAVNVGEPQIEKSYCPFSRSQKRLTVQIYASELDEPKFVDKDCIYVGQLTVDLINHDGDLTRSVKVALTFSDTEISVVAKDEKTGIETHVAIDFLG